MKSLFSFYAFYLIICLPIGITQNAASIGNIESYIDNIIDNLPIADEEDYENRSCKKNCY